jgi:hypothetical protein
MARLVNVKIGTRTHLCRKQYFAGLQVIVFCVGDPVFRASSETHIVTAFFAGAWISIYHERFDQT